VEQELDTAEVAGSEAGEEPELEGEAKLDRL